jgi:PAS domain S-box-containing protein
LVRLDDEIRALSDPAAITDVAARLLAEHLSVQRCSYAEVNLEARTVDATGNYTEGVPSIVGHYDFSALSNRTLEFLIAGRVFTSEDTESDEAVSDSLERYRRLRIRALIGVPLMKSGRLVASMDVHSSVPRKWRADEIELVQLVANRCWESIERTRVQRELRDSEQQFRTLANAIPNLAWMAHADGYIFWYNRRWYEYTGTTAEQMQGWGWQSVHDPAILPLVLEHWKVSLTTGHPFEMVFPLKGADGSFRAFLTRVEPIRDENGRIVRWFGTNTDVTSQQEAESREKRAKEMAERTSEALRRSNDDLRRANDDLNQFAYSASHDLREPLRMISIYTQLLGRKVSGHLDAEGQQFASYVLKGASRLEALIRDLLAYTKVAEATEAPAASTDANQALQDVLSNLSAAIGEAGAQIHSADLPRVAAAEVHVTQLFQNLIGNAVKYRGEKPPEIRIDAVRRNERWEFSVADNGIGIEEQYKEHIFGIFKRLHNTDEFSGTGIGLAICQRIVQRYGGRIWVESEFGRGSTFFFTLPSDG